MKRILFAIVLCGLIVPAFAADFTPGYTFSDVESDPNNLVTSNTLAQLVANATARTNLIGDRAEITVTGTNYQLLMWTGTTALKRVSLWSLLPTNSIRSWQLADGAVGTVQVAANSLTWSNLSTNALDGLTLYSNLLVNAPTNGPGTNTFFLSAFSDNTGTNGSPTNLQVRLTPLADLTRSAALTNLVNTLAQAVTATNVLTNSFTSLDYSLSAAQIANTNHNLVTAPHFVNWVVVCNTADAGYTTNDEVQVWCVSHGDKQAFASGANSTNVFLSLQSTSGLVVAGKDGTASATFTASRWKARCYARP